MTRENAFCKGRRLLTEARLNVTRVDAHGIEATCRGDSGEIYQLGYEPGQVVEATDMLLGWWCSCPARGRCSHLVALMLVVTVHGTVKVPAKVRAGSKLQGDQRSRRTTLTGVEVG